MKILFRGILSVILLSACQSTKRESAAMQAARAEILHAEWQKKAVYGIQEQEGPRTRIRRVYVPAREINGVRIPGAVQDVKICEDG